MSSIRKTEISIQVCRSRFADPGLVNPSRAPKFDVGKSTSSSATIQEVFLDFHSKGGFRAKMVYGQSVETDGAADH